MKQVMIFLVKIYQKVISPLFPARCKYYPTCSKYAVDAFKKHGFFKGLILAVWRILRCNPWSNGGIDPVPEKFTLKRNKKGV
ncbi:MAG: membrane protein insertion efficiency factor YidD [Ruminococcus sp.]|nr:membrane protein insertion efficiency factor YidD [Ruminococcus sp.]